MKVNYFHYYLSAPNKKLPPRISSNLLPLVQAFAALDAPALKHSFDSPDGEKLFLLKTSYPRIFLFVSTRDQEIIKAMNRKTLSCLDIKERLEAGESVGFASYVYLEKNFFAIATTMRAPKSTMFAHFLEMLLVKIGLQTHVPRIQHIESITTKNEVLEMAFVGKTTFEIDRSNNLFGLAAEAMGLHGEEVDSLVIQIKPKPRANFKSGFRRLSGKLDRDGVRRYQVKAKAALEDELTDYYLTEQGTLFDMIERGTEKQILSGISQAVHGNKQLAEKLEKIFSENNYVADDLEIIARFSDPAPWVDMFPSEPLG